MQAGNPITIDEEIAGFFQEIPLIKSAHRRVYTDKEKAIIRHAYLNGYPKHIVAEKLGTSVNTMRQWWRNEGSKQ